MIREREEKMREGELEEERDKKDEERWIDR